jgi:DNA-binding NarL/FixJ family response regulator
MRALLARLVAAKRTEQTVAATCRSAGQKHVTHILEKLGVANRTGATTRARELGLLS